jgi:shikimate dehydrogenase
MLRSADRRPSPGGKPAPENCAGTLKLGLIGDNIAQSKAPLLHRLAGEISGRAVTYKRLVPRELDKDFDETFEVAAAGGYRGLNITYPYKELAARRVEVADPLVRAMGAVNTVLFDDTGPRGFNTDYSGFIAAYQAARSARPAGRVCMVGAGGVGKAVAFGLLKAGLEALWILDLAPDKAEDLATRLRAAAPEVPIATADKTESLPPDLDGVVNCTQVGMVGYEGTPLPPEFLQGEGWAFDAIYTPLETQFLRDAATAGRQIIGGYELFLHQGVDAWRLFSGLAVDATALRRRLSEAGAGPNQD